MGRRQFDEALDQFRQARAAGARGFLVDFGVGSALLDTRREGAAIPRARACRGRAAEPRGRRAQPCQSPVSDGPRRRGRSRLPRGARPGRRVPASLRPRDSHCRQSRRHPRRRARGTPQVRGSRSSIPSFPVPLEAHAGPASRRLPLLVLQVGQLDEAGLGGRQPARPQRARPPPALRLDGAGMRGIRLPASTRRRLRGPRRARRRGQQPSASRPPSSTSSSTSTATAPSAGYRSSPFARHAPSPAGSTISPPPA